MTFGLPASRRYGRGTFCGSGGGSDCPALRVLPDGRVGVSSSEDGGPRLSLDTADLTADPSLVEELLRAVDQRHPVELTALGTRIAVVIPAVAQDGPAAELAFEGHEIHQLATGYVTGTGPADVQDAIAADLAAQPA